MVCCRRSDVRFTVTKVVEDAQIGKRCELFCSPFLHLRSCEIDEVASKVDVDGDVVNQQRQRNLERKPDATCLIDGGQFVYRVHERKDRDGPESQSDDGQVQNVPV